MYLGVDYYPEHWDYNMMDEDMSRISNMGCNIIRIGEFAWHKMEKTEGEYDFSFFDEVVEKAKLYNLKVMFGTPTATFPAWLCKKHPEILSKDEHGIVRVFGGRRQYCFNSDIYKAYCNKIVTKLVSNFKDENNIIAWQVDNEFGHEGSDMCYCEKCHEKFILFLKNKYETIDNLNEIYGTIFWGQTYNDFDEIPLPINTITTHNPVLKLDYARFRNESINKFAIEQISLVKSLKGGHQEVTHNFFGGFFSRAYDQNIMSKELDFASYDNYPVWGGLTKPITPANIAMTHDYIRGLKNKNYWIVEELMGAQGHDVIGYLPRPNQAKMWSYQAFAHGCENMLYFRWRGMNKGAEQFCLGIIDYHNKNGRKYEEVKSFMSEISKYKEVINSEIKSDVAVLYDFDNIWSWNGQRQASAFDFDNELLRLYTPFYNFNTNIDVISIKKDLSKYKVLLVPVMQIVDKEFASELEQFAKNGGTIVFSFRSGIRDKNNNIHFENEFPCFIRELAGITIEESEVLSSEEGVAIVSQSDKYKKEGYCNVWRDLIKINTAKPLYKYNDKFYSDMTCISVNDYGKGKIYYVGAGVEEEILNDITFEIIKENKIRHIISPKNLEVYVREYNNEEYVFINNHCEDDIEFGNETIAAYESKIKKL